MPNVQLDLLKREWIEESVGRFQSLARVIPPEFTTDDLHRYLEEPPHDNYWGSLVATMKKLKMIRKVGYRVSARPTANCRPVSLWARN